MVRSALAITILGALLVLSGCGATGRTSESGVKQLTPSSPAQKPDEGKRSTAAADTASATDNAQASRAKPAKQAFPEIEFEPVRWIGGAPTGPAGSGVWVYTKAAHPGNISSIDWETKDLLLVQLPTDRYAGYGVTITALQPIAPDVVRIVCRLTPPSPTNSSDKYRQPREYAMVRTAALADKRFIVADDTLQEIVTD
jgi:hypothetical protein